MSVLTCKLPAALDGRLAALARRRGVAKSVIVREAIESTIAAEAEGRTRPPRTLAEALGDGIGSVASGRGDLARNKRRLEGYGR
jgi:predicted transcriptional regulator